MDEFIKIENLSVIFDDGTVAADDINLSIKEKEFLVLVGPSGCGKSTILRSVVGLQNITNGQIFIENKNITKLSPRDRDIAMIFQSYALYPHMTVYENLSIPLKLKKVPKDEIKLKIDEIANMLSIEGLLKRYPRALSGGQKQRVAMGRALIRKPKVFLMDEPLSNLDAQLRVEMRSQISILQKDLGVTTIYVTHDQVEAMTLANRIAVMNHGKLLQFDKPQVIFDDPSSKFVAGFIGSPAMNLIDGRVENKKFIADGIKASFDVDFEGDITLGVRPDKIHIVNDNETNNGSAKVYSVELTGEANLVTFKVNNQNLIVKTDKNTDYEIDSVLKLNFNKEDCYFFDINSEERLRI